MFQNEQMLVQSRKNNQCLSNGNKFLDKPRELQMQNWWSIRAQGEIFLTKCVWKHVIQIQWDKG